MLKFKSNKFKAYLFVVLSLTAFLLLGGVYLIFYFGDYFDAVTAQQKAEIEKNQVEADVSDPYITKVPNAADYITAPFVDANNPSLGNADAKLTVVIYSDYDCEYCKNQIALIKSFMEKYKTDISLVWKDYPDTDHDSASYQAAVAARCAGEQNRFWEFNKGLMTEKVGLTPENFLTIAGDVGLDKISFKSCLKSGRAEKLIDADIFEANALRINGVPDVYVNDKEFLGGIEADELEMMVNNN